MITLKNDILKIKVKKTGAELCEISSVKFGTQFMWNANPEIWANYAPNLFPIVGMLKDETYFFENKAYYLSKHGFIRNNPNFQLVEETNESIGLKLNSSEQLLKVYPFKFEYHAIYQLVDNYLQITYKIINTDSKTIYFSLGGHPAFKCPVYENEGYSDYQLIFEKEETSETHLLNLQSGLVTSQTKAVFDTPKTIQLRYDLFNDDALIFKDLKSRKIILNSKKRGNILTVHFEGFPYLGLWAKPNADYVCIEPWLGIADNEDSTQQLTDKEGILTLDSGFAFAATYTIEIHRAHLV
ncbi:MAG: aldose 1-epimerase family protein [Gelidibacter sp.]